MDDKEYVVAKPFNSVNRRFRVGDHVNADEIELSDGRDLTSLTAGRFIVGADTKTAKRAEDRADEAPEPPRAGPIDTSTASPATQASIAPAADARRRR